jgi:hypothetical protein
LLQRSNDLLSVRRGAAVVVSGEAPDTIEAVTVAGGRKHRVWVRPEPGPSQALALARLARALRPVLVLVLPVRESLPGLALELPVWESLLELALVLPVWESLPKLALELPVWESLPELALVLAVRGSLRGPVWVRPVLAYFRMDTFTQFRRATRRSITADMIVPT